MKWLPRQVFEKKIGMDPRVQRFQRQGDTKKNMQVRNHSSVSGHHHPVCFVRTCVWSHMRTEKAHQPRSHWETEEKKTKGGSNVPLRNILQAASMKVVRYNYCWCNPRNRLLWTIGTLATFLLVGAVVVKWLSLFKARKQRLCSVPQKSPQKHHISITSPSHRNIKYSKWLMH